MYRNRTATQKNFAVVPRADIPRSKFRMRQTRKQAFNASELIPIMVEEVLPGDTWQHHESILARLATPIAPLVDDMDLETFYFFVPNRITWPAWQDFITGITANTAPGIAPYISGANFETLKNGVFDHMGLPPQINTVSTAYNALPVFAYFGIWNEWFRDQNLQTAWTWSPTWTSSGSQTITQGATPWDQKCLRANKRHDYFTSSLPFAQKGTPISIPLGTTAPVVVSSSIVTNNNVRLNVQGTTTARIINTGSALNNPTVWGAASPSGQPVEVFADLSGATAATINALRLSFQTQKLLERDARGGSRYVEQILAHWGVRSPDMRLQRPEYLGGSKIPVTVNPIAQTATYAAPSNATSPVGNLGGEMHASGSKRTFTYGATEHGYIIGLALVRATPTYQQGVRRHWKRQTRLDYFFPVFSMIGEQAVKTTEIYQPLNNAPSNATWGYQEAWAEYRYTPNEITGQLRSTVTQPLDWWHLAEKFVAEPALNASFITDKTQEVLNRALAAPSSNQWSAQIIMDILHEHTVARLMPTYSVPGLIDHF